MSLLDSLLRSGAVGEMAKRVINDPRVIEAAGSFLSPDDNTVGTNNGGLGGILDSLRNAGMGQTADSWVGNGANEPITPDQLESAVGSDTLREFAQQSGVQEKESAGVLAGLLPELVNQLTQGGQVPQSNALGGLLKQLLR